MYFLSPRFARTMKGRLRTNAASAQRRWLKPVALMERISGQKSPVFDSRFVMVIVPFMAMEPPYDEFMELVGNIHEWWSENGKNRERVGELMLRLGMRNFFKGVGLPPVPQTIRTPRANPFFFWHAEDFEAEAAGRKYIKL